MGNSSFDTFRTISGTTFSYKQGGAALFTTDAIGALVGNKLSFKAAAKTNDVGDSSEEVKEIDPERKTYTDFVPWYDDNEFPHQLIDKLSKISMGKRALTNNADFHFGNGIIWAREEYTPEGKRKFTPVLIDDWNFLVRNRKILLEISNALDHLETLYINPVQFIFNKEKTRLNAIKSLKTPYFRFKPQDDQGNIPGIIYSAKFPDTPAKGDYEELPLFDPSDPFKHDTCVYMLKYDTLTDIYYPRPDYYSVFDNGWVDIHIAVPKMIKAIYSNAIVIKWHIKIPKEYFYNKYKDWNNKDEQEQIAIFKKEQTDMEDFLTGVEKAGKAFVSIFELDDFGKDKGSWSIEPLKSFLESNKELPNAIAADAQIAYALNIDPETIGMRQPGSSNLGASGSGKRNGMIIKQSTLSRERMVSLDLLLTIAQLNGYPTDVWPMYVDHQPMTLDENPTGSENVINQ